jgi:hypothetical protein
MTINVGLGTGGKAQQFAQAMAIAKVETQMATAGKTNWSARWQRIKVCRRITNENSLHLAMGRAARADAQLRDEMLAEAFTAPEAAYTAAWRSTTIDDVAGRETSSW